MSYMYTGYPFGVQVRGLLKEKETLIFSVIVEFYFDVKIMLVQQL